MGKLLAAMIAVAAIAAIGLAATAANTPSADFQNDAYPVPAPDLNPPPLPLPQTIAEAEEMVENNPVYDESVPIPVRCDEGPIDIESASDAVLEEHLNELMACLVRVWQPPVTDAGWEIVRPTVTVYGEEVQTKCGEVGINAVYCAADQQVYFSRLLVRALPEADNNRWVAYIVIAHEFAHALQARTNILISAKGLVQSASEQEQLVMSRRIEVQADCLSAMFLRSVSRSLDLQQSDLDGIESVYRSIGDDVLSGEQGVNGNHGLGRSRVYWGNQGLASSEVTTCNTYLAEPRLVR